MSVTVYKQRYVTFLDILGFREIVAQSLKNPFKGFELEKVLGDLKFDPAAAGESSGYDPQYQSFSDSIVISATATPKGLVFLLNETIAISVWLLSVGILTRGGIAKGALLHERGVMFGPAFNEAYELENTVARYARILPAREVYSDFVMLPVGMIKPGYPVSFAIDDDGPPYLDILTRFHGINEGQNAGFLDTARQCRAQLQVLLDESMYRPPHFEKVRWLAGKWNLKMGFHSDPLVRRVDYVGSRQITWEN